MRELKSQTIDDAGEPEVLADRYRLEELLGAGGMGSVWRAYDLKLQREVAVKRLKRGIMEQRHAKRFFYEATAMAALAHPNIVKVHAVNWENAFLVLEFVKGKTLRDYVGEHGPLSAQRCTELTLQALDALTEAHSKDIIHRDLKPSNLMIDENGQLRVLDFGVAKLLGIDDQRITKTDEIVGTPEYISPEQCGNGKVSARSDIYALGCCMYFMLTGKSPFTGDSVMEVFLKQLNEHPDFTAIRDEGLGAIVQIALAKDPADRFQSAEEMASCLRSPDKTPAAPVAVPKQAAPAKPRHLAPYLVPAAVALILLLLGWAGYNELNKRQEAPAASPGISYDLEDFRSKLDRRQIGHADLAAAEKLEAAAYATRSHDVIGRFERYMYTAAQVLEDQPRTIKYAQRVADINQKYNEYEHSVVWSAVYWMLERNMADEALKFIDKQLAYARPNLEPIPTRALLYDRLHICATANMEDELKRTVAELQDGDIFEKDREILDNAEVELQRPDSPDWIAAAHYLEAPYSRLHPGLRSQAAVVTAQHFLRNNQPTSARLRLLGAIQDGNAASKNKNLCAIEHEIAEHYTKQAKSILKEIVDAAKKGKLQEGV